MSKFIQFIRQEHGFSLIETALLLPVFLLVFIGTVDLGRAFYVALEVSSAAQAGALYGSQNSTDTTGMVSAAQLDAQEFPAMTSNASYGCECSDGSSPSASCSTAPLCLSNIVNYVTVSTSLNYTTLLNYPMVPHTFALNSTFRMRAAH